MILMLVYKHKHKHQHQPLTGTPHRHDEGTQQRQQRKPWMGGKKREQGFQLETQIVSSPRCVLTFFIYLFYTNENLQIDYLRVSHVSTPTDPPSLQTRDGGPFMHINTPTDPTLAPNASRWGFLSFKQNNGPALATNASRWAVLALEHTHRPHPRSKREPVGLFSFLNKTTDPPSLQTRVGGPFLHLSTPTDPTLAPNAESVGSFFILILLLVNNRPHPRYKHESVGSFYFVL
jgi:hypothetical protein